MICPYIKILHAICFIYNKIGNQTYKKNVNYMKCYKFSKNILKISNNIHNKYARQG